MATNIPIIFNNVLPGGIVDQPNQVYFVQKDQTTEIIVTDITGNPYPLEGYYSNTKFVPFLVLSPGPTVDITSEHYTQLHLNQVVANCTITIGDSNFDSHGCFWLLVDTKDNVVNVSLSHPTIDDTIKFSQSADQSVLYRFTISVSEGVTGLLLLESIVQPTHRSLTSGFNLVGDSSPYYIAGKIVTTPAGRTSFVYYGINYNLPGFTATAEIPSRLDGTMALYPQEGTVGYTVLMTMGTVTDRYNADMISLNYSNDVVTISRLHGFGNVSTTEIWFQVALQETFGIILEPGKITIQSGGLKKQFNFLNGSTTFTLFASSFGSGPALPIGLYFPNGFFADRPMTVSTPYVFDGGPVFTAYGATFNAMGEPIFNGDPAYYDNENTQPITNGFKLLAVDSHVGQQHLTVSFPNPTDALSSLLITSSHMDNVITNYAQQLNVRTAAIRLTPELGYNAYYRLEYFHAAETKNRPGEFLQRKTSRVQYSGKNINLNMIVDNDERKVYLYLGQTTADINDCCWVATFGPNAILPDSFAIVAEVNPSVSLSDAPISASFNPTTLPLPDPVRAYYYTQQREGCNLPDYVVSGKFCYHNGANQYISGDYPAYFFRSQGWEPTLLGNNQIRISTILEDKELVLTLPYMLDSIPLATMVQVYYLMDFNGSTDVGDYNYDLDDDLALMSIERTLVDDGGGTITYTYKVKYLDGSLYEFSTTNFTTNTFRTFFNQHTGTLTVDCYDELPFVIDWPYPVEELPNYGRTVGTVFGVLSRNPTPDYYTIDSSFEIYPVPH